MLDWMRDQGSETDGWRRRRARHRFASLGGVVTTRVAALADVHGDLHALTRVVAVIERARPDEIWCLGNVVGLGADAPPRSWKSSANAARSCSPATTTAGSRAASRSTCCRCRASAPNCSGSAPSSPTNSSPGSPGCQHERRHDIERWHGSAQHLATGWSTGDADAAGNIPLARARLRRAARPMARGDAVTGELLAEPFRVRVRGPISSVEPCLSPDSTTCAPPRRRFSALRPRDR